MTRVVIVHWNQPAACLATVDRFRSDDRPVRITVVDNHSTRAAVDELRAGVELRIAEGSQIDLIPLDHNAGFGPGANVGLRRFLDDPEDGEWCVLAPHDVEPFPGTLAAMLDSAAGEPMAGLMCADVGDAMVPVIDPYFGGMAVPSPSPPVEAGERPSWETVDYPHGTMMMLRRACLTEVGLFDERYFSYCEEADLALRARRAGWQVGLIRGARVRNTHIGSGMAVVDYLQTRNTLLLVQEMSGWYHAFIRTCFTIVQTIRGIRDPSTRALIFHPRARVLALRDFALRRFGPPPPAVCAQPTADS